MAPNNYLALLITYCYLCVPCFRDGVPAEAPPSTATPTDRCRSRGTSSTLVTVSAGQVSDFVVQTGRSVSKRRFQRSGPKVETRRSRKPDESRSNEASSSVIPPGIGNWTTRTPERSNPSILEKCVAARRRRRDPDPASCKPRGDDAIQDAVMRSTTRTVTSSKLHGTDPHGTVGTISEQRSVSEPTDQAR